MICKIHEAKINNEKTVTVWGTGKPRREFLHVDDAAAACFFIMKNYDDSSIVNIGCGEDHSIKEMAEEIKKITGFKGDIVFDTTKPDGTMQKLLDVTKMTNLGWKYSINLTTGLESTYKDFSANYQYYITKKSRGSLQENV
jgi:GDP-L-fucose synthase